MRFHLLFLALLLSLGSVAAVGDRTERMKPKAPIQNFRLPRFGDQGYTEWVLRGAEGIYQNADQIDVSGMALRIYSGDERMVVELALDSPFATILSGENRAISEAPIEIVGASFKISGRGWSWDGTTKKIEVHADSVVEFSQRIGGGLGRADAGNSAADETTTIYSKRLSLRTGPDGYFFEFTDDVRVESSEMQLTCQSLIAIADAPDGARGEGPTAVAGGDSQLESVRQIVARKEVVILQSNRVIHAGEADFFPREESLRLSGLPRVEMPGAFLSGETIRSHKGRVLVTGAASGSRAQMILTETGGLGIQGKSALSEETIVLADRILMREGVGRNEFVFDGRVDVMSGAMHQRSDKLTVFARGEDASESGDETFKVGEVYELLAEGNVVIEQNAQLVKADRVVYYPLDETAELTGAPEVSNGESVVRGQQIDLKPGKVVVRGTLDERVVVVLPAMEDLGYEPSLTAGKPAETEAPTPASAASETIVKSRIVEMTEHQNKRLFRFIDSVDVNATNLELTCRQMDVSASAPDGSVDPQSDLQVERIVARDEVLIVQTDRTATCDTADILPDEGKVILTGNATVDDAKGKVMGHRITLNQGERRSIVDGKGSKDGRARITIPGFDSAGSF